MTEYTQGVCEDGAVILKDGQPMAIEQVLVELNNTVAALDTEERKESHNYTVQVDRGSTFSEEFERHKKEIRDLVRQEYVRRCSSF